MINLKSIFPSSSLDEWIVQLKKELRGDDFEKLLRIDEIEGFSYPTFHHADSNKIIPQSPGNYPFTRGAKKTENNVWSNGYYILIDSEKSANLKAREILMKGCDLLIFDMKNDQTINWDILFHEIHIAFISVQIVIKSQTQFNSIIAHFKNDIPATIKLNIDFVQHTNLKIEKFISETEVKFFPFCLADGFSLQQCGANTWQEIGYAIASAHDYFVKLIEKGLSPEKAISCIHFSIGIGTNYFYEIAKIRALRQTWSMIIKQYLTDVSNENNYCHITAHIGHLNKSLSDPHTNLLRQTTEAMSAISGGVDALVVHPYDSQSLNGTSILAERMAINISLILKEESYFDAVIDPLGGSYAIEELTQLIAEKAWGLFQKLEEKGGVLSTESLEFVKAEIEKTSELRKENFLSGKYTLIGMNKFSNPKPENNNFQVQESYLGLEKLILENALKYSNEKN